MSSREAYPFVFAPLPGKLPAGYRALPALAGESGALRVCVLIADASKKPALLRESLDARVLLGALVDHAGSVHQWLEIHEQNPIGPALRVDAASEVLNGRVIDERWCKRAERMAALPAAGLIRPPGGWFPGPVLIDLQSGTATRAADASGRTWKVCSDDAMLKRRDLSVFGASLQRYLIAGEDDKADLVALHVDALRDGQTFDPPDALGLNEQRLALGLAGGMLITSHAQFSFERYVDALGAIPAAKADRSLIAPLLEAAGLGTSALASGEATAHATLSRRGAAGATLEVLHHKLALLLDITQQAAHAVAARNEPLLNLSARSVRVRVPQSGAAMPATWAARAVLVEPGAGAVLPIAGTRERLFLNLSNESGSVYQATGAGSAGASASGTLRVRRVIGAGAGATVLEGTLTSHERIRGSSRDCVWMRLGLDSGRCDLLCRVDPKSALASGEVRLTSLEHQVDEHTKAALKALEGQQVHDVHFELAPMVSSAADVYAMGVLAIRTLIADERVPLNVAWDDIQSLASEARAAADGAQPGQAGPSLSARIAKILRENDRFAEALGPHRVAQGEWSRGHEPIETGLWADVLACIVKCFPGVVPESYCRDLGDAPPESMAAAFAPLASELAGLLARVRGMLIGDPAADAELVAIVRALAGAAAD